MKKTKIASLALALIMSVSLMAGCAGDENTSQEPVTLTADELLIEMVADSALTEPQMVEVVRDYYENFNLAFDATGEDIEVEVVHESDNSMTVYLSTSTSEEKTQFEVFDSPVLAFAYLYSNSAVSLDGEITEVVLPTEDATAGDGTEEDDMAVDAEETTDEIVDGEEASDEVANGEEVVDGEEVIDDSEVPEPIEGETPVATDDVETEDAE